MEVQYHFGKTSEEKSMKRRIVFFVAVMALVVCTAAFVHRWRKAVASETTRQSQANSQSTQPPPHISYWVMFQHIALLNQQAEEAEQKGQDGSKYRKRYQTFARLTDPQAEALNAIALDTHRRVGEMDARAKAIVAEVRARTPNGRLRPGEKPPEVPAELKQMQTQRNQLIESGYNKLREAFGATAFSSFDNFVKKQIEPNLTVINPKSLRPPGNQPQLLDKAGRVQ
jgi:hypothetical protein